MTQIPFVPLADIDAAIQTQPTAQPQTQQQPASELDRLLDKPLAPIKFVDGAYVVEDMGQCYRVAKHYIAAGLVPRGLEGRNAAETLGRVAIAIEYGQQFGWSPIQSMQSIMVVNGRPCLWGDGPMGVVLRSGKCLDFTGTIEGTGDERVAVFTATRTGGTTRTVRFSVADAKRAGLWGKSGPWANYPERMLLYRARAFCLRDLFADALAGIGIAEEHDEFAIDRQAEKTKAVAEGPAKLEIHDG
jgi:hypothetical protein